MMKKKIFGMVSVCAVVLALGACSKEKRSSEADADGITTLTFFNMDLSEDDKFDNPVAKEITKRTGVKLEISHPVGGDEQAIPLMIASGDYPDLIYGKNELSKLVEAGAVEPLDTFIEEKGDNLKKMYGDRLGRLKHNLDDPQIYHVGTGGGEQVSLETSGTFQVQLDVLKDLGYPDIKTLDDFEKALKDYMAKYPEIDGQKTIGMTLLGSDWRWILSVGNPSGFVAGYPDEGEWVVDEDTLQATYKYQDENVKEYFKWLNRMYDEGLVDPESFTQKYDTYIAKISAGNVLALADKTWNYSSAVSSLKGEGKNWRTYAPLPVTLHDDILNASTKQYGFTGYAGVSISSTSEQKEKAFEFLDWMASEEAQILNNWGVEGINYEVVDGKRVALDLEDELTDPNFKSKTGIGMYKHPFPTLGNGSLDSEGQSISRASTREATKDNYTDEENEVLSHYDAELWVDLFPSPEELGQSKHGRAYEIIIPASNDLSVIQQRMDDYVTQAVTDIIISSPDQFEAKWTVMQDKLDSLGVKKANDSMTQLIENRVQLWEE